MSEATGKYDCSTAGRNIFVGAVFRKTKIATLVLLPVEINRKCKPAVCGIRAVVIAMGDEMTAGIRRITDYLEAFVAGYRKLKTFVNPHF